MGRFRMPELVWSLLFYAAVAYTLYVIFDTGEKVRSTNKYIKSLDDSLVRWMADPRDSPSLPNS